MNNFLWEKSMPSILIEKVPVGPGAEAHLADWVGLTLPLVDSDTAREASWVLNSVAPVRPTMGGYIVNGNETLALLRSDGKQSLADSIEEDRQWLSGYLEIPRNVAKYIEDEAP